MLKHARLLILAAACTAVVGAGRPAAAEEPEKNRLSLDLYLEFETVADPQLSPDGRQIIYTRGWIDRINDKRESSLWIMDADGGRNRFLVNGSGARWSPNGDRIAYTAEGEPKGTQVFVRWMDAEGATSQITRVEQSPRSLAWSPDGTQVGFTMLVEERTAWPIEMPTMPSGARWTEAPRIVERLNYRRDRLGYTDIGYRHIFLVPASGGTPRQITSGPWDHNALEWTPDGQTILFSGLRIEDAEHQWRESEIYAVDLGSRAVRQLTTREGPDNNPVVSPDGRLVAYTGYDWTKDTWVDKLPWEDPSEHLRRSPLTYVGNVRTPTMLMTGVNDLRTPIAQTEQFYSALRLLKAPTAMVRFNNEWHGTSTTPSNFIRTQLYLRYWFERHKRPSGTRQTTP